MFDGAPKNPETDIEALLEKIRGWVYSGEIALEYIDVAVKNRELSELAEMMISKNYTFPKKLSAAKIAIELIKAGLGRDENVGRPLCIKIIHNHFIALEAECEKLVELLLKDKATSNEERHALELFFPGINENIHGEAEWAA